MTVNYVYFIATRDRSMVKIGFSRSPQKRLRELAAASPVLLDLLATAPGRECDERALHERFLSLHVRGEWFNASPELMNVVCAISISGTLPEEYRGDKNTKHPLARGGDRAPRSAESRALQSATQKRIWAKKRSEAAKLGVP